MNNTAGPSIEVPEDQSLCDCCKSINLQDLKSSLGYKHQPTWQSLLRSSRFCALCKLLTESIQRCLNKRIASLQSLPDDTGPVRLVAAGRTVPQQSCGRHVHDGAVNEVLLWKEAALIFEEAVPRSHSFSPIFGAQVIMAAVYGIYSSISAYSNQLILAKGSTVEAAGLQGLHANAHFAFTDQNIRRISDLLNICRQHHSRGCPQCSLAQVEEIAKKHFDTYGNSGLPSRLIDVDGNDQSKIKLIDVKGRNQYLALSYRWGESQSLVTTMDNLSVMRKGIEITRFPRTIQDAILICRMLKIRYLWVDALCIVQKGDNNADWSLESQKMGLIYAHAYATIAVASAKDSDQSFLFTPRVHLVKTPFKRTIKSQPDGSLLFAKKYHCFEEDFEAAIYENSLARRGWVMQERLLSRRTIHFTERQIYWECGSLFWAENGDTTTPMGADSIKMAATFYRCLLKSSDRIQDLSKNIAISMLLTIWSELVTEYSKLQLTLEKDRLPAIRGMARIASLYLPGRYLSGLWEHNLSSSLLWTPQKRPMTLCQERWAPSWSWASTTDAVLSHGGDIIGESESSIVLKNVLYFETPFETLVLSEYIQGCEVSLKPQPKPKGRWKDPPAEDDTYSFWPQCSDNSENDIDDPSSNSCRFDGERGNQTEFLFLRVECSQRKIRKHCRGLLLTHGDGNAPDQTLCTRIGLGWSSHHVWHDGPTSTILLR
jgi:hypothetical protein